MGLDREIEQGIWETKEEIHKRTSISSIRLRLKMRMEVDILDYIIEEISLMECKDKWWRPVVYLLKSLNKTERNYKIHNKEMLVVIRGLKNWRHLLASTKFKFKGWTNNKNLEYFI